MSELGSYSGGLLYRHEKFQSRYVPERNVDVWCPSEYERGTERYSVIYMHDGQNLFEPQWSYSGIDWGMDEAIEQLLRQGDSRGAIVVGIWNTPRRQCEYMPQKPLLTTEAQIAAEQFTRENGSAPESDAYLCFIVEELKPYIDATYATRPDPAHTFVMGSSMGALVSLYALIEYPEIFSGAGCLSTHWPAGGMPLLQYLGQTIPRDNGHRIYFDYGTDGEDAAYEPFQVQMDALMQSAGYVHGENWITHKFYGADHSERSWRERVEVPLKFLLR